tara:strand:- start:295 stop:513 length:219 start_codon:yes stop_codon:yes gene_type:complete
VNIIFDIHARAEETFVWLGLDGAAEELEGVEALRTMETLSAVSRDYIDRAMEMTTSTSVYPNILQGPSMNYD